MEVEQVLKYIKLYTGCEEHALNRIKPIIEQAYEKAKQVVYVREKVIVEKIIRRQVPKQSLRKWSELYFKQTETTYEEINERCRKIEVCKIRNEYCKQAYENGYTASEIGRYLKRDHTTILHNIFKIKTK
jgi:chromosomal replication initiation ATPase DnaA